MQNPASPAFASSSLLPIPFCALFLCSTSPSLCYSCLSGFPRFHGFAAKWQSGNRSSGCLRLFIMRWMLIALLVSLGALLLAAAGVARHIVRHRALLKHPEATPELAEETELETEH